MRFARFEIAPWTALLLIWLRSGSALAQAPSNDAFTGATPVVTFPFDEVLDTSQANTDSDDAQLDGGGNGGSLSISFTEDPPVPTLDSFIVNHFGTFDPHTGGATITGTYTCSNGDVNDIIDIQAFASQRIGRFTIVGSGFSSDSATCDGAPHSWSVDIMPENGNRFTGGQLMTAINAFACNQFFQCSFGGGQQTVVLRGGPP